MFEIREDILEEYVLTHDRKSRYQLYSEMKRFLKKHRDFLV